MVIRLNGFYKSKGYDYQDCLTNPKNMTIVAGILTLILWGGIASFLIEKDRKGLAIIWFFIGGPISMFVVVYALHMLGLSFSSDSGSDCEVDYSRAGVSSVHCGP